MNKYKLLILICFFLIIITLPKVTASVNNINLLGKVIILDAGHGGVDAGATGNQIIEKDLNLILTKKFILSKELLYPSYKFISIPHYKLLITSLTVLITISLSLSS